MGLALAVLLAVALYLAFTYNSLTRLRLLASNAWSDIDVQLKRRARSFPPISWRGCSASDPASSSS
jgi:hypothetical protein